MILSLLVLLRAHYTINNPEFFAIAAMVYGLMYQSVDPRRLFRILVADVSGAALILHKRNERNGRLIHLPTSKAVQRDVRKQINRVRFKPQNQVKVYLPKDPPGLVQSYQTEMQPLYQQRLQPTRASQEKRFQELMQQYGLMPKMELPPTAPQPELINYNQRQQEAATRGANGSVDAFGFIDNRDQLNAINEEYDTSNYLTGGLSMDDPSEYDMSYDNDII